ncbi:uncharacterized protein [Amphiura filiformis]|uniref:uncharacterized protein n=1 Tax=Amphiura filiformis TaxID=82378 RepID=UPI003B20FFDD
MLYDVICNADLNNLIRIYGNSTYNHQGTFSSPLTWSPILSHWPTSLRYTYLLRHLNSTGHIRLAFDDFFLDSSSLSEDCNGAQSFIRILDGGQSETYCSYHRPPSLISYTNHIKVEFHVIRDQKYQTKYNKDQPVKTYGVFKANYAFVSEEEYRRFYRRLSERCDELTTLQVAKSGFIFANVMDEDIPCVDYIWYIKSQEKQHILLNFLAVQMDSLSFMEVYDGLSSDSPLLAKISINQSFHQFVISSQSYVSIRWKGIPSDKDRITILYTNVDKWDKQVNCVDNSFPCPKDGKCISRDYMCDGNVNCSDGSDEDERFCHNPALLAGCACRNGATCQLVGTNFKCKCPDNYSGENCEDYMERRKHVQAVISRCNCKNGGTCTPTSSGFGFVCNCPPGYGGYDCSQNNSLVSGSSTTEYGIAMGAAVVAVLLVLFGVGLCLCVILQYLRQQRDGPEGQYRPALSRDVYSVEAVNLAAAPMEPNDCIPPSYSQCRLHNNGHSAPDTAPSDSNSHTHHHNKQKTPESPPPNYEAILALSKDLSPFYRQYATKESNSSASPQSAARSYQNSRRGTRQNSAATTPGTPQDNIELNYVDKT